MRDFLAFCTLLACLFVLASALIALVKPLPKLKMATRKQALAGLGVSLCLFLLTAAIMPEPKQRSEEGDVAGNGATSATGVRSVAGADQGIVEVDAYPETKHSTVQVELGGSWSTKDIPVMAGMVVESVGKVLKEGASDIPDEIETMNIWFTAPTRDRYGKDGRNKVLEMRFKIADLRAVEYGKISPQRFLELPIAIDFGGPIGRKVAEEYCADNAGDNPMFCAKLVR